MKNGIDERHMALEPERRKFEKITRRGQKQLEDGSESISNIQQMLESARDAYCRLLEEEIGPEWSEHCERCPRCDGPFGLFGAVMLAVTSKMKQQCNGRPFSKRNMKCGETRRGGSYYYGRDRFR